MKKTALVSFLTATLLFLLYHGLWWFCRRYQIYWPLDLNLPGFFMLLVAYPWSSLLFSYGREMTIAFGPEGRQIAHAVLLSIGLGVNCAAIACLARGVFTFFKVKARTSN
ncbi:hypothetical protein HPT27_01395 [Permianibacter sp. IMCC34836]|uniref:hypothetical protein n=1 Tax=Permianibacter fluminis TaxID=2738515 RepID=UPI001556D4B0|nr:hypothetical protein [Permianibacter fluminis]NQD35657.1 hypothetical protein [Permianibacter fluminis]